MPSFAMVPFIFAAVGGAGAILSKCIKESEVIAYDDLGNRGDPKIDGRKYAYDRGN